MSSPRVERVVEALLGHAERAMKVLAAEATAELTEGTPVDTGWARANWIPNIGSSASGPVGVPGEPASGAQAMAVADVLASYRLEAGPIHITNRAPYIRRLEAGWSSQKPNGFVRDAITAAMQRARRALGSR